MKDNALLKTVAAVSLILVSGFAVAAALGYIGLITGNPLPGLSRCRLWQPKGPYIG